MSRDPEATSKARRAERRENEKSGLGVITIKPISSSKPAGGGFKKGGFKNAFGEADQGGVEEKVEDKGSKDGDQMELEEKWKEGEGDESEDDGLTEEERYDPTRPTGCGDWCKGRLS